MNSVEAGVVIALTVAGWPLYQLVTDGDLDASTALLRGAGVAVACAYGVTLVVRLVVRFEEEIEAERQRRLDELYTDMEAAVAEGSLTADTDADADAAVAAATAESPAGGKGEATGRPSPT